MLVHFADHSLTFPCLPLQSLRILCLTNLFCWMSLVCYSLYFTDFVGEAVFGGDPQVSRQTERERVEKIFYRVFVHHFVSPPSSPPSGTRWDQREAGIRGGCEVRVLGNGPLLALLFLLLFHDRKTGQAIWVR